MCSVTYTNTGPPEKETPAATDRERTEIQKPQQLYHLVCPLQAPLRFVFLELGQHMNLLCDRTSAQVCEDQGGASDGIEEIRRRAQERFEELARYLYPNARKEGCHCLVASANGEAMEVVR
jgi:hypothetical protein